MQRWRYHSLLIRDLSIADSKLNAEGEKGWDLVNICLIDANSARAYFKMPIDETDVAAVVQTEAVFASPSPFG